MPFNSRSITAALLLAWFPQASAAERPATSVNEIIELVRARLPRHDDKGAAKALAKVTLNQRLDLVVVEHLESEGAGPLTVQELSRMVDATANLPPPTPPPGFPHPPIPSRAEMTSAIHRARVFAAQYASNLPNFLCSESVVRYEDLRRTGAWDKRDTLGLRLSFEDGQESDKLVTFNGRPTGRSLRSVAGAQTNGEFGSLMLQVLDPASKGKFRWDHWTLLRNRPTQVYSYRIDAADSHYKVVFGGGYDHVETIPAMEGMLYLDGETNDIARIVNHAADIEPSFPVQQISTILDYASQEVGGNRYDLPLRAETRMGTAQIRTRNVVDFSGYRKFEGESSITFDDADPSQPPKIKH